MYCDNCGTAFSNGQSFCQACGKPIVEFAAKPVSGSTACVGRVSRHVHTLGMLTIVGSVLGMVRVLPRFGLHFFWMPHSWGVWSVFFAAAGVAAGIGLIQRQSWARPLALVVNTLAMVHVPFGTLLGLYTLWVLLPRRSEMEYRQIARVA